MSRNRVVNVKASYLPTPYYSLIFFTFFSILYPNFCQMEFIHFCVIFLLISILFIFSRYSVSVNSGKKGPAEKPALF
ncbi:hypothetical protein D7Z94_07135 [Ulvibacterium marinum]|uniref:Uncharacterized protein n=1 Tax=Ulvibacterium marinum TaxID=2419782 RepID=A0A3B0CDX8_9FLAO|nr:hypothetical protein D7Z94_07135 [Ulvibacterium marinum]